MSGIFVGRLWQYCRASLASHSSAAYLYGAWSGGKITTNQEEMPIFFQHQINDTTRLGIWKIEESEAFFKNTVPQHRDVTHPHKRLQHLAGRFLLQFLYPAFPYELIQIADTRKPYLPDARYHFSISHCGDYAAAIVSEDHRVGIDIEIPVAKIGNIAHKFLSEKEEELFQVAGYRLQVPGSGLPGTDGQQPTANGQRPMATGPRPSPNTQQPTPIRQPTTDNQQLLTLLWSAKEAVFKWDGNGGVDFRRDIRLDAWRQQADAIEARFGEKNLVLPLRYQLFPHLVLAWLATIDHPG